MPAVPASSSNRVCVRAIKKHTARVGQGRHSSLSEFNALIFYGAGKLGKEFAALFRPYEYACNFEDADSWDYKCRLAIANCILSSLER